VIKLEVFTHICTNVRPGSAIGFSSPGLVAIDSSVNKQSAGISDLQGRPVYMY